MSKKDRHPNRKPEAQPSAQTPAPQPDMDQPTEHLPEDADVVADDDANLYQAEHTDHEPAKPFMVKVAGWLTPSDYEIVRLQEIQDLRLRNSDLESQIEGLEGQVEALNGTLESAKSSAKENEEGLDSIKKVLDSCLQEKNELNNKLTKLKEAQQSCDAEVMAMPDLDIPSGKSPYLALIEAYKTLSDNLKTIRDTKPQTSSRSLAEILSSPSSEEKRALDDYLKQALEPAYYIPNGKDIKAFITEEIRRNKQAYTELEKEKNRIEGESVLKDTPEYFKQQLTVGNPEREAIVNDWITAKINELVANEDRKLAGDTLDLTLKSISDAINAPRTGEEAGEEARKECLKAIGVILGGPIESTDGLGEAARRFADNEVKTRVLDKIKISSPDESELIERVNADIDFAEDIRKTLEKAECETIEDFRDKAVQKSKDDLLAQVERRIKETGDQELVEVASQNKGIESMTVKLAGIAKKRNETLNKYVSEAEAMDATNNTFATEANIQVKGDKLSDRIAFVRSELDARRKFAESRLIEKEQELELKANALTDLEETVGTAVDIAAETLATRLDGKTLDQRLDRLNSSLTEKINGDAERISTLTGNLATETERHNATFEAYLATIRRALESIGDNTKAACESAADSELIRKAIETNILTENPAGDYEYFCKDLSKAIDEAPRGDADGIRKAIHATVREYQQSSRATWMDVLVRLYLYSRVPFISEQFLAKNINTADLARGVEALSELLAMGGLSLTWPELFRTRSDEGDFEFETIRNIDSYVDDVAGHVGSDNVVIDLYCAGMLDGGEVIKKPIVSLFN